MFLYFIFPALQTTVLDHSKVGNLFVAHHNADVGTEKYSTLALSHFKSMWITPSKTFNLYIDLLMFSLTH